MRAIKTISAHSSSPHIDNESSRIYYRACIPIYPPMYGTSFDSISQSWGITSRVNVNSTTATRIFRTSFNMLLPKQREGTCVASHRSRYPSHKYLVRCLFVRFARKRMPIYPDAVVYLNSYEAFLISVSHPCGTVPHREALRRV